MEKIRHKWGSVEDLGYTKQQKCLNCDLYRFMALGSWYYTHGKHTQADMFHNAVQNKGCLKTT